jgi:4-alpha-glucanotransferase
MKIRRSAGILLHPTSLPGKYGIGDLGNEAYEFIDFLVDAGQSLWQVLPLGPTGYGDSPYQCFSAFAGSPLLISPDKLIEEGLLKEDDVNDIRIWPPNDVDFGEVIPYKTSLLEKAFENFQNSGKNIYSEFKPFIEANNDWLEDFALFMSVKNHHNGIIWSDWSKDIATRSKGAVNKWKDKLKHSYEYQIFVQAVFDKQWKELKKYANENDIMIMGDLPIFIAYDSSDLWANKELFSVDNEGRLETVAGVPPDYFSETGQLWGNPLYKWDKMEENNFLWWQKRMTKMYEIVDIVRIDHFRGFEAYWEIPGDAKTAINGEWIKAPGYKLFNTLKEKFGDLPIVAEDLGVITKEVEELRDTFEFPGMKILQFAFGDEMEEKFLPHNHIQNCVVYTGSHDNDTTRSFFEKEKEKGSGIYEWAQYYMNYYGEEMTLAAIKTAYASVANIVFIPLQDILNLGNEARMNFPSTLGGNWTWRYTKEQITKKLIEDYRHMSKIYGRLHDKENDNLNSGD